MARPGSLNTICDVPGLGVGQAEDPALTTGVTVVLPEAPAICAVDHRGGGIGSRDTALLGPGSTIEAVHALCLSGGSAYGLDAAGGVMQALRRRRIGFSIAGEVVPIVPAAIIFDLACGAPKSWDGTPWWELGRAACETAGRTVRLGNAGAGLGATAGPLKGGTGSASYACGGYTLGALAIVNPVGSTVMPGTGTFWEWHLEADRELGGQTAPTRAPAPAAADGTPGANTTLAVVATDAALSRDQALRLAIMAQDGLARAIRPAHGPLDGDTVFALSTGAAAVDTSPKALEQMGALAADCVARAIMRGVYAAESLAGYPSYRARHGTSAPALSG